VRNRFLLTFDDGPHTNTALVLDKLANNRLQRNIKAIFSFKPETPPEADVGTGAGCSRKNMPRVTR
jgi:hypothetical protein